MTKAEAPIPSLRLVALTAALALFAVFGEPLLRLLPEGERWWSLSRNSAMALVLFLGAYLVHAGSAARLTRRKKGVRPVPKVALDLLRVALFAVATLASLSLFFRHDLSGILTGSGLVLAVLGFAIRNVVADTFSGLALGLEAPFRIGDWVSIDGLAQGRVQEIGWRSTRLITRDSTHVILPNSQISRQKITNFSAPRPEYRDHVELTLPITLSVSEARNLISAALQDAETILQGKKPEVQVARFGPQGITFRVKYWVPRHDLEVACRDEVFSRIDARLRTEGVALMVLPEAMGTQIP
ncbi:mechanosensitive ion channel family protein [Haematobacter missouriensis]|uniref:Small-conductance mechanosensitive channel n=1 Tax=Haematobacter missouriensis TaxID=366616 RepID=A0ABX3ZQ63_9RHOB|nr:mechanosensitive ion channel domain-containing protein [Haematobacter missouriensis]OWJ73255.1 mechanosensitive ion channel protein [Haematobacter missouriensis]